MTGVTSGQTALATATDSDDVEVYSTGPLTTVLQTLANLFDSVTGHDHTGAGKGKPIPTAGLAAALGNFGAGVAFIPTINQAGAITTSSAVGFYIQIGKLVVATIDITISGTGTAGNDIIVGGLPITAQQRGGMCFGTYFRTGVNQHSVTGSAWAGTTTFKMGSGSGNTSHLGTSPSFAVVNTDVLRLTVVYEAT